MTMTFKYDSCCPRRPALNRINFYLKDITGNQRAALSAISFYEESSSSIITPWVRHNGVVEGATRFMVECGTGRNRGEEVHGPCEIRGGPSHKEQEGRGGGRQRQSTATGETGYKNEMMATRVRQGFRLTTTTTTINSNSGRRVGLVAGSGCIHILY